MGVSTYHFPAAIGDTVYIVYSRRIYPCEVTGFQITEHGEYICVRYPDIKLGHPVLLSHICLSLEEAEKRIREKKEEQAYEESTDGGA